MSSKVLAQVPLLMVQRTTVPDPIPAVTPVIVVVGLLALVIEPGPDCIDQAPVPTTAVLAAIVKVLVEH